MNNDTDLPVNGEGPAGELIASPPSKPRPFFGRTDWQCFWVTTVIVLAVYLFTLSPEVGMWDTGIFATAAMYGGVPHPAGFPLWSIYAHLFTVLLPFSNIAWRVSVSSAVAGAMACGLIALMVSRIGAMMLEGLRNFQRLDAKAEKWLRIISGYAAGMAFGLDDCFWGRALIPDPWPLSLLLFAATVCLLLRWRAAPEQPRHLYAALFVYALALTNSQSFLAAALGVEFLILSGSVVLGRDIFAMSTLLFGAALSAQYLKILPDTLSVPTYFDHVNYFHYGAAILAVLTAIIFTIKTRGLFTKWKTVFWCGVFVTLGLSFYFYVAIASTTNPPINWGYPRTVEGFFHVITRGQYERVNPVNNFSQYWEEVDLYWKIVFTDYGWLYLLPTAMPFLFLHRMRPSERNGILGLVALFLCTSFFLLAVLNPSVDKASRELTRIFFAPSHLILALWTGWGLILLGTILARRNSALE